MNIDRANDSAANLSLFMVNVAYCLQTDGRQRAPQKPEPVLLGQILHKVACLGCIHASQPSFSFS
jgi:hypothetical protein